MRTRHHRSDGPLTARPVERLRATLVPGAVRRTAVRRIAAAVLVVIAVALAVRDQHTGGQEEVVVAATALQPGQRLTAADLTVVAVPTGAPVAGALRRVGDGVGRTVTGPIPAGELVTTSRLLTPRLPEELTGDAGARLVPVQPADPAVIGLLAVGDVVDVLDADGTMLARDAVVAVTPGEAGPHATVKPVLLAMTGPAAHRVAVAGLREAPAVVLH